MKNPYVRVITINIIQIFILGLMFVLGFDQYIQSTNLYIFGIAGIGGSVICLSSTLLFYKFVDKQPLYTLGFGFKRKHVLFSLSSILSTVGMYLLYYMALSKNGIVTAQFSGDYFSNAHVIPMFIITALAWFLVGLNEEVAYRGYFVANFKHLSTGKLFFISSVLFTASHVYKGFSIPFIFVLVSSGMTMLYIYLKSGSLLAASFPHFIYDFLDNQLLGNSDISILQIDGRPSDIHFFILHLLFIVIHIILVRVFFRQRINVRLEKLNEPIQS
ncbi:CPBP family intramembrane glutamic endopeptidase [Bacillus songklensis]|uniref:CPBP family intramembrane glutamic endopeptidase n=1 Tax=Bacillus songklensis TaxID=1069116 RepID=A0ABV8B671_9BACI